MDKSAGAKDEDRYSIGAVRGKAAEKRSRMEADREETDGVQDAFPIVRQVQIAYHRLKSRSLQIVRHTCIFCNSMRF